MKSKILIVDDDPDIRIVLTLLLKKEYETDSAENGLAAVSYIRHHPDTDLVILDVMMPEMDGITACEEIRKSSNVPILFLTAKSAERDRIAAYSGGGDDYLTKPFSHEELLAKVHSLLRRYTQYRCKPDSSPAIENLEVDYATRSVRTSGNLVQLTDTEFSILEYLIQNRGTTVTAPQLYEAVWNERFLPGSANTVMVHVLNLRRKVEQTPSAPKIIRTIWGKGYQID